MVSGADGLLSRPRPGLTILDSSTNGPLHNAASLAAEAAAHGVQFADTPPTRGLRRAAEGRLNVIVGTDKAPLTTIEPLLRTFAENVFHAGPVGAGHTVKLLNDFCVQAAATAISEAFGVASKAAPIRKSWWTSSPKGCSTIPYSTSWSEHFRATSKVCLSCSTMRERTFGTTPARPLTRTFHRPWATAFTKHSRSPALLGSAADLFRP